MSNQPKKKTVAQLRAEKEKRKQDVIDGLQLFDTAVAAFRDLVPHGSSAPSSFEYDERNAILLQANRACEPLHCQTDSHNYRSLLHIKAQMHSEMGQQDLALATYRQADDLYVASERKGLLQAARQRLYTLSLDLAIST